MALGLAFLPSALFLVIPKISGPAGPSATVLWLICVVSPVCCFTASSMLFPRNNGLVGLWFLLLNAAISFYLGCVKGV